MAIYILPNQAIGMRIEYQKLYTWCITFIIMVFSQKYIPFLIQLFQEISLKT